ncbi:unnamed protein product [Pseudo-nitzschia multistriata]|uniref:3-dehydroquinate synthase n=1 Tax=Pseudo-nitzschia multistriata TaxID=183589 RepID=A0A448ZCN2_9STRA|nr:unnamed protein product [Pseudo-nitzschia multistriata]
MGVGGREGGEGGGGPDLVDDGPEVPDLLPVVALGSEPLALLDDLAGGHQQLGDGGEGGRRRGYFSQLVGAHLGVDHSLEDRGPVLRFHLQVRALVAVGKAPRCFHDDPGFCFPAGGSQEVVDRLEDVPPCPLGAVLVGAHPDDVVGVRCAEPIGGEAQKRRGGEQKGDLREHLVLHALVLDEPHRTAPHRGAFTIGSTRHRMLCHASLLFLVLWVDGCHPFRTEPGRPSFGTLLATKRSRFGRRPTSGGGDDTALFENARRMEIWWDGRGETQIPPAISLDEPGEAADRWIVDGGAPPSISSERGAAGVLRARGGRLEDPRDQSVVGAVVALKDSSGQEQALAAIGSVEWILVEVESQGESWQMIPAENLVAAARSTGTKLAFAVEKASDVAGLAKALELGVDALCIAAKNKNGADDPRLWETAFRARRERNDEAERARQDSLPQGSSDPSKPAPEIVAGSCYRRDTKGTVLADRVCVDLVQRLGPDDGCWVGSSAKTMALVLSEAAASRFVPTRPFRINAGPVHSYILLGDGVSTKYLCELQPSDEVTVYNLRTKRSRAVAVGRLKEEVRPCVLVEFQTEHKDGHEDGDGGGSSPIARGQTFLQQAETVRLGQPSGRFLRVTDLEAQGGGSATNPNREPLLLRVVTTGTHVGKAYTGKVEER